MGCFLGCFQDPKERKRLNKSKRASLVEKFPEEKGRCSKLRQSHSPDLTAAVAAEGASENPVGNLSKNRDQGADATVRKKVTFDLNVTTFENVPIYEEPNDFSDNDGIEKEVKEEEDKKEEEESNVSPKLVTYPTNHRYQNCESSDDEGLDEEEEEGENEEIDFDEEGDEIGNEESYDSFFSLQLEGESKNFNEISSPNPITSAINKQQDVAKANVRDRSTYIHSVLNPVENLSHWKEVKVRVATFNKFIKENIDLKRETQSSISPSPVPTLKARRPQQPISLIPDYDVEAKQEIAVDASLSNWLVSPNISRLEPEKSNSILLKSSSQEERPILGALTIEDIKQASRTASPRSSPSRSNEEIPIIGTVGSYWSSVSRENSISSRSSASENRGIPNTTSKYREDKMVNWHCTPFETRLERALCEQS